MQDDLYLLNSQVASEYTQCIELVGDLIHKVTSGCCKIEFLTVFLGYQRLIVDNYMKKKVPKIHSLERKGKRHCGI